MRAAGIHEVARVFEESAQEVMHAFEHSDMLYPKARLTPAKALEIAIEGETCHYTEMYPKFRYLAVEEGSRERSTSSTSRSPKRRNKYGALDAAA